jgi:bifunctional DNA-binding transcriptional regulator/antitoxin component of YhaV-PrlF toxin-antitoxin module
MVNEFESFYDTVKDINGILRVTIPSNLVKFTGIKVGDIVKVMIQKKETEQKEE